MSYENTPADLEQTIAKVVEGIRINSQYGPFLDKIFGYGEARLLGYNPDKVTVEYFEEHEQYFSIVKAAHMQRFAHEYSEGDQHRRAQASRFINGLYRAGFAPVVFGHELRPQASKAALGPYFRYRVDHYENQLPVYEPVLKAENIQELAQQDELLLSCRNIGPDGVEFFKRFCADVMLKDMKPE